MTVSAPKHRKFKDGRTLKKAIRKCSPNKQGKIVYVLKLQNNKIYVGQTNNCNDRIKDHFLHGAVRGAAWTRLHKPIDVLRIYRNADEQLITQKYMAEYGIDNVRGGPWCETYMSYTEKKWIRKILNARWDCCYNCGRFDHFASECDCCTRCGHQSHEVEKCRAIRNIYPSTLKRRTF